MTREYKVTATSGAGRYASIRDAGGDEESPTKSLPLFLSAFASVKVGFRLMLSRDGRRCWIRCAGIARDKRDTIETEYLRNCIIVAETRKPLPVYRYCVAVSITVE